MSTLVLRLAGPTQSWGGPRVSDTIVPTETVPTRAALLGMICAGLGLARNASVPTWVQNARITVRVDQYGELNSDFQTINPAPDHLGEHYWRLEFIAQRANNTTDPSKRHLVEFIPNGDGGRWRVGKGGPTTAISVREYLSSAEFIVAITVDDEYADDLVEAVRSPKFCTYLGRKAFPATFPYILGTSPESDHEVLLSQIPAVAGKTPGRKPASSDEPEPTSVTRFIYPITGYRAHHSTAVDVPTTPTREDQLAWLQRSLTR